MKFSIIIPLYNKAKHIKKTLDSIFSQPFHNFEVIIINDGSNDKSEIVVNEYIIENNLDKNVFLFNYNNQGVSVARNLGITHSCGQYLILLDADDILLPYYLEDINNTIDKISGNFDILGYSYRRNNKLSVPSNIPDGYINYFKFYLKYGPPFCSSSVILNANSPYIGKNPFPSNEWLGEDIYTWTNIITLGGKVYFRNIVGTEYICCENSAMTKTKSPIKLIRSDSKIINTDQNYRNFILYHKKDFLRSCLINADYRVAKNFLAHEKKLSFITYRMIFLLPNSIIRFLLKIKRTLK